MAATIGLSCSMSKKTYSDFPAPARDLKQSGEQHVVLAAGCFWCVEGVFERLPGVTDVVSGYAGDREELATYEIVCSGKTRHAEAVQVTYDADKISYGTILKIFFSIAHDPTQLNRQGGDVGTQYRSAIFVTNDEERAVAQAYIKQLDDAKIFPSAIVTTIEPLEKFFVAEQYHQDYARLNPNQPYVASAALPKIEKAEKVAQEMRAKSSE